MIKQHWVQITYIETWHDQPELQNGHFFQMVSMRIVFPNSAQLLTEFSRLAEVQQLKLETGHHFERPWVSEKVLSAMLYSPASVFTSTLKNCFDRSEKTPTSRPHLRTNRASHGRSRTIHKTAEKKTNSNFQKKIVPSQWKLVVKVSIQRCVANCFITKSRLLLTLMSFNSLFSYGNHKSRGTVSMKAQEEKFLRRRYLLL